MLSLLFMTCVAGLFQDADDHALRLRFEAAEGSSAVAARVSFSSDGAVVVAGSQRGLTAWKVPSGRRLPTFPTSLQAFPRFLSSSGQSALTFEQGVEAKQIVLPGAGKRTGPCLLPGGSVVLPPDSETRRYPSYMYKQKTRTVWDLTMDGKLGVCVEDPVPPKGVLLSAFVEELGRKSERPLSHQRLVVFTSRNGKVRTECHAPVVDYAPPSVRSVNGTLQYLSIRYVAFSPAGTRIAAQVGTGEILVWDTKNGSVVGTLRADAMLDSRRLLFHPAEGPFVWLDEETIATRGKQDAEQDWVERSRRVYMWRVTGDEVTELTWQPAEPPGAGESAEADSQGATAGSRRRSKRPPKPRSVAVVAISPDVAYAAAILEAGARADYSGVELVELNTGRVVGVLTFPGNEQPIAVAFSADSGQLAIATNFGSVYVSPVALALQAASARELLPVRDVR